MKIIKTIIVLAFLTLFSCGGSSDSSDSSSSGINLSIISPESNSELRAGDTISFELSLDDFNLAPPFNLRSIDLGSVDTKDHPGDEDDTSSDTSNTQTDTSDPQEDSSNDSTSEEEDEHDDEVSETNPDAREGHYHVYLDDAAGDDEHLTSWDAQGEYQLPSDITEGAHSLRFELRDNNHAIVGAPDSEAIMFFSIIE